MSELVYTTSWCILRWCILRNLCTSPSPHPLLSCNYFQVLRRSNEGFSLHWPREQVPPQDRQPDTPSTADGQDSRTKRNPLLLSSPLTSPHPTTSTLPSSSSPHSSSSSIPQPTTTTPLDFSSSTSKPTNPSNQPNPTPSHPNTHTTTTRSRRLRPTHWRTPNSTYFKSLSSIANKVNSRYIINLSSHTLTPPSERVLSKGLNFVPTPKPPTPESLLSDFERFSRSLRVKHFFGNKPPPPHPSTRSRDNRIGIPLHPPILTWKNTYLSLQQHSLPSPCHTHTPTFPYRNWKASTH